MSISRLKLRSQTHDDDLWRLVDFLEHEYSILRLYLGEIAFDNLTLDFVGPQPPKFINARNLCQQLPSFLSSYGAFKFRWEIPELAQLELALNTAFAAPDAKPSATELVIHPSAQCLRFRQNTLSIWSALKCESAPPKPHSLEIPQTIIVWRQGASARFRILGNEEASAYHAASLGLNFEQIVAQTLWENGQHNVHQRCATYLEGWVAAEILTIPSGFMPKLEKQPTLISLN